MSEETAKATNDTRGKRERVFDKQYYRPDEAANYLGVSRSTLYSYIRLGKLKTKKLSAKVTVISREWLHEFADNSNS